MNVVTLFAMLLVSACGSPEPRRQSAPEIVEEPPAPAPLSEAWTEELRLESAPFDAPGAPSVIVHASPSFDRERPIRLAIFLHGWSGCARVLMSAGSIACRDGERAYEGWDLAGRFDDGGSDALFVIPQLAFMQRDGSAGRFVEEREFRAFLAETLGALGPRIGAADLSRVESIALFAHSAGYETALAILTRGGVPIDHVVLFDALYRGVEPFLAWAVEDSDRRLVSLYTGEGRTARQNEMLAARARTALGDAAVADDLDRPLAEQVASHRVVVMRSPAPHGLVPSRHLAELLAPLGLSDRE